MIHSVESVVIEWCHQVRDVLETNSADALLEGLNPGPVVEVQFWKERCADLFFIMDQVTLKEYLIKLFVKNIIVTNVTQLCYWLCFLLLIKPQCACTRGL